MKRFVLILLLSYVSLHAEMIEVPIVEVTDNEACNYFFSLIFFLFLIITPSKFAIQLIVDYANRVK